MTSSRKTESVSSFYNAVADDYDNHMTASDKRVRETLSFIFRNHVSSGGILDFGGGTGLDLAWLRDLGYRVYFLEPSFNMRAIAKKKVVPSAGLNDPMFIEDNTNFCTWTAEHSPIPEKLQGVLANMGVLNCIEKLDIFFEKMAGICNKKGHIIATVLDSRPGVMFKQYSIFTVLRLFFTGKVKILNEYKGTYHETYVHSIKSIRKASDNYFEIKSCQRLAFSAFTVLILFKK